MFFLFIASKDITNCDYNEYLFKQMKCRVDKKKV